MFDFNQTQPDAPILTGSPSPSPTRDSASPSISPEKRSPGLVGVDGRTTPDRMREHVEGFDESLEKQDSEGSYVFGGLVDGQDEALLMGSSQGVEEDEEVEEEEEITILSDRSSSPLGEREDEGVGEEEGGGGQKDLMSNVRFILSLFPPLSSSSHLRFVFLFLWRVN